MMKKTFVKIRVIRGLVFYKLVRDKEQALPVPYQFAVRYRRVIVRFSLRVLRVFGAPAAAAAAAAAVAANEIR